MRNDYQTILVTGGCGFVGSNLAMHLHAAFPQALVIALDNFYREGSRLNAKRLAESGVRVVEGDVRREADLLALPTPDLILDCAAEPSVMAGADGSPRYLIDTNLGGTVNVLELARTARASLIFLSTSRIYPLAGLRSLSTIEAPTRLELAEAQSSAGASRDGIAEAFPLGETRTLYGATKLASELLVREYVETYGLRAVIARCGVIAGPWQFGKVDQGVVALWAGRHLFGGSLSYIGYGGTGKQVRDFMHVDDLASAVDRMLDQIDALSGRTFNVGGGRAMSFSLMELTAACEAATGSTIPIASVPPERAGDIPVYLTDHRAFSAATGWEPKKGLEETVRDVVAWMREHREDLAPLFA